jgi:inorganic pyrophosphatase
MTLTMIVEWSKGSLERYRWAGERLVPRDPPWPAEWGPAPVNYGLVPKILNPADGDEVDALWPGEGIVPGTRLEGELLGMVWLSDGDHKLILGRTLSGEETAALVGWFSGRDPRITSAREARAFLAALTSR